MDRPYALSIVVPVYNGASSIGELVHAVAGLDIPGGHEMVLAVDGSPDNSLTVCHELARTVKMPITVVNLARNFGEHNAVMAGIAHTRGRHVVTMDDDLQNPPEEVKRLHAHIVAEGRDVIYTRYAIKQHAGWRNLGSRFTNWMADFLIDKPKGLYLSSFRIMSAFIAEQITKYAGPYPYVDGLIFQVTKDVGTLEVKHLPRAEGRSNYTLRRLIRLWLAMFLNFSVMPLRGATLLGLGIGALGALAVLVVLVETIFIGNAPRGYPSLMAAVLLISGVQLVMLGLIGEYLGRLYLTTNQKPQYVVRDVTRTEG